MKNQARSSKARKVPQRSRQAPFSDGVGKTLRRRRLELELSLDEVVAETRIQKPIIKAIEGGNYDKLTHNVHNLGFVRRYAALLGLDGNTAAAKYSHERGPLPEANGKLSKQRVRVPIIGSKVAVWLVLGATLILVGVYLIWQLAILTSPPSLEIIQPPEDQIAVSQNISIIGVTTPGADVSVNGQTVYVGDDGKFSTDVVLRPGLNEIRIMSVNRRNQSSIVERNILYQPSREGAS